MADFEEMRNAVQRALLHTSVKYLFFCNSCKTDYVDNAGTTVEVPSSSTHYQIWYCQDCFDDTL